MKRALQKQVVLLSDGKKVEYWQRFSRRSRRLKLRVNRQAQIEVIQPTGRYKVPESKVEQFIEDNIEKLRKMQKRYQKLARQYPDLYNFQTQHYRRHKEAAREMIKNKLTYYCRHYSFRYQKLQIRNQSGRWGSCSSRGTLSFTYRLLFLPPAERDYIIVHELCHLKEMNHSVRFWQEVARIMPDYRQRRRNLKRLS